MARKNTTKIVEAEAAEVATVEQESPKEPANVEPKEVAPNKPKHPKVVHDGSFTIFTF